MRPGIWGPDSDPVCGGHGGILKKNRCPSCWEKRWPPARVTSTSSTVLANFERLVEKPTFAPSSPTQWTPYGSPTDPTDRQTTSDPWLRPLPFPSWIKGTPDEECSSSGQPLGPPGRVCTTKAKSFPTAVRIRPNLIFHYILTTVTYLTQGNTFWVKLSKCL